MNIRNRSRLSLLLIAGVTLAALTGIKASSGDEISVLLEKVVQRRASYPEMTHWQASVQSTAYEMDKNWKPKKKTVVHKIVRVKERDRQESIQSAIEIKNGKNKDVTQEYINRAYKEREKNARRKREEKNNESKANRRRHMDMTLDEFFPFGKEKRVNYDFAILDESSIEGIPVQIIETHAKQRTEDFLEGKYYIDRKTFDILRVELQFAKNPGPLKRLEMGADFQIHPQGYHTLKSTSFRIHVGLVVKNIRMEAVEEYSNYQILD
ncbi:MAG: hypothetical protein JXB23_06030 [Candidatus Aminicenantes bacterium]|nr:hypothetical protein [Candidatus Aminicenantes bacterium]